MLRVYSCLCLGLSELPTHQASTHTNVFLGFGRARLPSLRRFGFHVLGRCFVFLQEVSAHVKQALHNCPCRRSRGTFCQFNDKGKFTVSWAAPRVLEPHL